MVKHVIFSFFFCSLFGLQLFGQTADVNNVRRVAAAMVRAEAKRMEKRFLKIAQKTENQPTKEKYRLGTTKEIRGNNGELLAYVTELQPEGFIITSADSNIAPVLGYSFKGKFPFEESKENVLLHLIQWDVRGRLETLKHTKKSLTNTIAQLNNEAWNKYASADVSLLNTLTSQTSWPEPYYGCPACGHQQPSSGACTICGTTVEWCEGWIATKWSQKGYISLDGNLYSFNGKCPYDPRYKDDDHRCVTGCTATAMAQILNYWRYPSSLRFVQEDRYPSPFFSILPPIWTNIRIDEDSNTFDFPSFDTLNNYIFSYNLINQPDYPAYLAFAAGIKLKTTYSFEGSSSISQSGAYLNGFGYGSAREEHGWSIWNETNRSRLINNIKSHLPVQLDIADFIIIFPIYKHTIVCDGYRDTGEFHLNMGWQGGDNAWYFLSDITTPSANPNYNTICGIVYNIRPFFGWNQYGADANNTFRTLYDAPTADPPAAKWERTCASDYTFTGLVVGARNKIYASCSPVNMGGSKNASLWIIDQFGTKEKELPLNNENQNLNCPVQDSNGYIYVSTGRGRIYKINPVTEETIVIFTEPAGQQFANPLKIDPDNQLYAFTLQKLYCLNNSGTVIWSLPLTGNKYFITRMPTIFVGGNRVFISYFDWDTYHSYLLSINRQTGSIVQTRTDCAGPPSVGPDGTIYAIGISSLYALNPAEISGTPKWTKNLGSDTLAANTPVIGADGTLYLLSKTSAGGVFHIKCQAVAPDDGTTKWEVTYDATMADNISQGYVAGNNVVVFTIERSNNYQLYAYRDAGDHAEPLWSQSYGTSAGDLAFGPGATIYVLPDTGLGHTIYALSEGAVGDPYGAGMNFQDNIPPVMPANPAPADKTQNIDSQVTLSWSCSSPSGHPLKYSLFVGELDNQMFPLATDIDCPSYTLSNLKPNMGYLWKIVVSDGQALTEGPIWVFATKPVNCDLNTNGHVDFADYAILARHWLETCSSAGGCEGADMDINWDKTVNIDDLALFVSNWLKTTGTFCTYLNWTPDADIRIFGTYNAAIPRFVRALPGGGWDMYYYEGDSWTYGDTGYATSNDGMTWSRVGRVMCHGAHDFDNINAVITDIVNLTDGDLRAYCEGMAFTGSGASNIFIADSTDGINWVNPQVVFVPQSGTLYSNQVSCPRIIKVGEEFVMYFVGSDNTTSRIFKTISSDGVSNWTPPQIVVESPTGGSLGSFYIVNCPETGQLRMFVTTKFSTDSGDCIRSLISVDNGSNWTWEDGIRLAPNGYSVENLICPVLAEIAGSGKMYVGGGHGGYSGGHWDTLSATCE
jgi:hypothetical protein